MNLQSFRMKTKPEFMIIPMIDIIFFLLVFFMMNSLQTVAQKALSVQLPQATSASAPAQLPVVFTLDAEGHITIDNNPMSIDQAEAMIKQRIQENPNASVILQADKRAAHGQVVAIMDMLNNLVLNAWLLQLNRKDNYGTRHIMEKAAIIIRRSSSSCSIYCSSSFVSVPAIQEMETYESTSHKVFSMMAAWSCRRWWR